jgi:hypothetical protein
LARRNADRKNGVPRYLQNIHERRRNAIVAVIYTVYGDESFDLGAKRVFAVAGVFGRQCEWDELSPKWFAKTGGLDFHAAQCESDRGDFARNDHKVNLGIYRDVTKLLCSTNLLGEAMVIDLQAYRQHFPDPDEWGPYYLCFAHVVMMAARYAYVSIPPGQVKFIFDQNPDRQYNAALMYDYMRHLKEWQFC